MKSGVSPQKFRKYQWKTPIWASICTPVAPSRLISLGHSPRLGGAQFLFGGHKQSFGGHGTGMPPVAPGLVRGVSAVSKMYARSGVGNLFAYAGHKPSKVPAG